MDNFDLRKYLAEGKLYEDDKKKELEKQLQSFIANLDDLTDEELDLLSDEFAKAEIFTDLDEEQLPAEDIEGLEDETDFDADDMTIDEAEGEEPEVEDELTPEEIVKRGESLILPELIKIMDEEILDSDATGNDKKRVLQVIKQFKVEDPKRYSLYLPLDSEDLDYEMPEFITKAFYHHFKKKVDDQNLDSYKPLVDEIKSYRKILPDIYADGDILYDLRNYIEDK